MEGGGDDVAVTGEPDAAGVHGDLGWALATALRAYGRAADRVLDGLPGGSRGYRLLAAAARDCPRSQLALAHHVGLDRTVVTYLVDDLTAAGLLERRPDPADRRTRRVVATEHGLAHLCELDARLAAVEDHVLHPLAAADRPVLRSLLQQLAVGLYRAGEPSATCADVTGEAVTGTPPPSALAPAG